ncbi:hypothetical protein NP493_908g00025 [Ridgeia piscesae]|uniref:Secreted protein n=1 Tax=Ridgeia piscesae TaxID=27915 RepID=A0AAD9KK13_RIDPI|nr:hypothetical protein NP493_908g00025 [Ridgeia piscesae]
MVTSTCARVPIVVCAARLSVAMTSCSCSGLLALWHFDTGPLKSICKKAADIKRAATVTTDSGRLHLGSIVIGVDIYLCLVATMWITEGAAFV